MPRSPRDAFRNVALSADETASCERMGHALLCDALSSYDGFVANHRHLQFSQWKSIKQLGDITLFRARGSSSTSPSSELSARYDAGASTAAVAASSPSPVGDGAMNPSQLVSNDPPSSKQKEKDVLTPTPRLLAVGSMAGSLEDAMYGLASPTTSAMRLRASHLHHDEFLDAAVLATLRVPTRHAPFQFVGIKWLMQRGPMALQSVMRPRDFVFAEYSGVAVRPAPAVAPSPSPSPPASGSSSPASQPSIQRIGFHILHSVELPQCPESLTGAVQRGALSVCYLYHERRKGVVDVHMTASVQPRGRLSKSMALHAASALVSSQLNRLGRCAENKKLAWLLQTQRQLQTASVSASASGQLSADEKERLVGDAVPITPALDSARCQLCSASLRGPTRRAHTCELCACSVCSQCSTTRTLRHTGMAVGSVVKAHVLVCQTCLLRAQTESASEIARQENWEDHVVRTARRKTVLALASRHQQQEEQQQRKKQQRRVAVMATTTSNHRRGRQPHSGRPRGGRLSLSDGCEPLNDDPFHTSQAPAPRAVEGRTWTLHDETASVEVTGAQTKASSLAPHLMLRVLDPPTTSQRVKSTCYHRRGGGPWTSSPAAAAASNQHTYSRETDAMTIAEMTVETATRPGHECGDSYSMTTDKHSLALIRSNRRVEPCDYVRADSDTDGDLTESLSLYSTSETDESRSSLSSSVALLESDARFLTTSRHFSRRHPSSMPSIAAERDTDAVQSAASIPMRIYQPEADDGRPRHQVLDTLGSSPPVRSSATPMRQRLSQSLPPSQPMTRRTPSTEPVPYQLKMWMQMNELRNAAETTFQTAKSNTESLLSQHPQYRGLRVFVNKPDLLRTSREQQFSPYK